MQRILVGSPEGSGDELAPAARELRDAGAEVVYLGAPVAVEALAAAAIGEDVVAVVVRPEALERVRAALRDAGAEDIEVRTAP